MANVSISVEASKSRHPELYDWVLASTPWIPSTAKFNERVFCILNEITEPVLNALGDPAKFSDINTGYLMKTYSADALKIKQDKMRRSALRNWKNQPLRY